MYWYLKYDFDKLSLETRSAKHESCLQGGVLQILFKIFFRSLIKFMASQNKDAPPAYQDIAGQQGGE